MRNETSIDDVRIEVLERIVERGQVWPQMAARYGVTNPVPPWGSCLQGTCDALDRAGETLPFHERRAEEDLLSRTRYAELPYPESQLVALAHSLIARGVIDEGALARRMDTVRARLQAA